GSAGAAAGRRRSRRGPGLGRPVRAGPGAAAAVGDRRRQRVRLPADRRARGAAPARGPAARVPRHRGARRLHHVLDRVDRHPRSPRGRGGRPGGPPRGRHGGDVRGRGPARPAPGEPPV
ncbi:MAG: Fluoride ion transporter CrcB, partial [uncultured Pseudonocardia sp.]